MNQNLAVSVVMPAYNAGKHIRAAVQSILEQSLKEFELIIVNDGSTDNTASECEALAAIDARIVLINQSNQGVAVTLNRGIQAARATLIARMDADDISLPLRLEHQVRYLRENPNIDLVSTAFIPFIDDSSECLKPVQLPESHDSIYATLAFCSPVCHAAVVARRELFDRFPYRKGIVAEDHDLWCRAIHHFRFSNLSEPLYLYRRHAESLTIRRSRRIKLSTLRSGAIHIAKDLKTFRRACMANTGIDRSLYPDINWRWMDRINRLLGIRLSHSG